MGLVNGRVILITYGRPDPAHHLNYRENQGDPGSWLPLLTLRLMRE